MTAVPPAAANEGNVDPTHRQRLRAILDRDGDTGSRLREVLRLGADRFGVELGLLVRVDPAGQTYTIEEVSSPHPEFTRGLTGDLLSTYCRMVAAEGAPLVIDNAPAQGWADDPAYQQSLLSTYVGTEVHVDGEVYGTICFVDLDPRDAPFTDEEQTFLQLLAQVVERVLEQRADDERTRQTAAQELSVVERRYRTALKHSPVLFAKIDTDLRYEWIHNPHPDFSPEAVVGKRDDEVDSGPGIDQLVDLKRRVLKQEEQIREEILFERSDGLVVYDITATPLREGAGDAVTGLVTAALDVTERKRVERKYRESEARYRALAENFPEGAVGVYDHSLTYTLVAGTLVGEALPAAPALEGNRVPEVFPADTAADLVPLFRAAVEEGTTDHVTTTYGERTWRVWATPLRDDAGEIFAGLSFARDITQRVEREQELRRAKEEAETASQLKTAMLGNMSHELRTPLTSIISFSGILVDLLSGQEQRFAQLIRQGGERLMDTLEAVLQLSRLEAGEDEGGEDVVRLRDRARAVLERRLRTEGDDVDLIVEVPDHPVVARSNEAAVDQILGNLLDNALKFTLEGGRVWLRMWMENQEAVVEVEDTGVGIGEKALPEIFRAFHQESKGLNRQFEGTGLGLAVTKRLVEQVGGGIEVESEKGEGSCFTVRLPRAEAPS